MHKAQKLQKTKKIQIPPIYIEVEKESSNLQTFHPPTPSPPNWFTCKIQGWRMKSSTSLQCSYRPAPGALR